MSQLAFFLARITPSIDLRWIPSDSIQLTGNKAAHQSADFDPEISGLGVENQKFFKIFFARFLGHKCAKVDFPKG
jgi:hypothetical protein